ncbi:MAG: outer membrane lipoprotein-sorting protein [Spirochaetota bacterium]|nr:outer membrane lipoprotein-sorting protein [Spirochaetota bacterium]
MERKKISEYISLFPISNLIVWFMAMGLMFIYPSLSHASSMNAREIMQRVEDRDDGDRAVSDVEMILIDKNKKQRVRKIRRFEKDMGMDTHFILFFLSPADVKDTGFLTYDYDDSNRDDDQWLYLPALRKVKRIASSDKSKSFMGSDFSYADMTKRDLDDYDFSVMKSTGVKGVQTWQLKAVPRTKGVIDEIGYTKSILFVQKDNYVVIRALHWVKKGKRLKYMDVKKLELIDGIWVATEVEMTTKKGKIILHKTILKRSNVRFNQDLKPSLFSVRQLEKGLL